MYPQDGLYLYIFAVQSGDTTELGSFLNTKFLLFLELFLASQSL